MFVYIYLYGIHNDKYASPGKYHTGSDSCSHYMWSDSLCDIYSDSEKENKSLVPVDDKAYLSFYQVLSLKN